MLVVIILRGHVPVVFEKYLYLHLVVGVCVLCFVAGLVDVCTLEEGLLSM
jgi:hypothetical protein